MAKPRKPKRGPQGEPIFPKSEKDLSMPGMMRYRTQEPFETIAKFYEEQFEGRRDIQTRRTEQDGWPTFVAGVGQSATDVGFATLLVLIDPATTEERKPTWHIMVVAR